MSALSPFGDYKQLTFKKNKMPIIEWIHYSKFYPICQYSSFAYITRW